jgi:hypothetical protein
MPWNNEQCGEVFESFWKNQSAQCPVCSATIWPKLEKFIEGQYLLFAKCPKGCGALEAGNADDPLRGQFREWSESEGQAVIKKCLSNSTPVCPVDGSWLDIKTNAMQGGTHVTALCRRCGKGWRLLVPNSQ